MQSMGSVRAQVNALVGDDSATADYFARVLAGDSAFAQETPLMHRWFELVAAAAMREPLLLLLDDLHFADETAVKIIVELAGLAPTRLTTFCTSVSPPLIVNAVPLASVRPGNA